jgi:hypothetical protein
LSLVVYNHKNFMCVYASVNPQRAAPKGGDLGSTNGIYQRKIKKRL